MRRIPKSSRASLPALLATALFVGFCPAPDGGGGAALAAKAKGREAMGPAVKTVGILDSRNASPRSTQSFSAGVTESPASRLVGELVRRSTAKAKVHFVDARGLGLKPADLAQGTEVMKAAVAKVPADVLGGIRLLGCSSDLRSQTVTRGSGSSAVQVTEYWYLGSCSVELTVVDASGKELATLEVEGRYETSRRDNAPEGVAVQEQAFWSSVDDAAKRLLDRTARKKMQVPIPFDEAAPLAAEGLAEIDAGRLAAARTLWEGALAANPASAGLRFNLGAVQEALGDTAAAKASYEEALKVSPADANATRALARLAAPAAK
ncbi:MAG: tetratricopeptide repeat protein [Thermoanaerobaculia bacterium]|nr:tetratricopeptide repeat protein [Thermoanaerobaculia bacterium]